MRLFELEDTLGSMEFVRVSRQTLVNIDCAAAVRPELNGRLVLEMAARMAHCVSFIAAGVAGGRLFPRNECEQRGNRCG